MPSTGFHKANSYPGYNSAGEFALTYEYQGRASGLDTNTLSAIFRFGAYKHPGDIGRTTYVTSERFHEIGITIPDSRTRRGLTRTITVDYDEEWRVHRVSFDGAFFDDLGYVRILSMRQRRVDLELPVDPIFPAFVVSVDGEFADQRTRIENVSDETLDRARRDVYEFCRAALAEVVAMQDQGRPVMARQLDLLKDYAKRFVSVRDEVTAEHAAEATREGGGERLRQRPLPRKPLPEGKAPGSGNIMGLG